MKSTMLKFKKTTISLSVISLIIAGALIHIISKPVKAAPTSYYFNNAVNTSPSNLGNYWYDYDATDPALELPDLSEDEVHILPDATYAGNAVFRQFAGNEGTVTGNASFYDSSNNLGGIVEGNVIFYGNNSLAGGTINGTKTRYFTATTSSVFHDYTVLGPWTVIADGVNVTMTSATYDDTTVFSPINGGAFIGGVNRISMYGLHHTLAIRYNKTLLTSSVPATSDYTVRINGVITPVTNVAISGSEVILTTTDEVAIYDTVLVTYVRGVNLVKNAQGLNAINMTNINLPVSLPVEEAPVYSAVVGTKLYVSNNHSASVTVIDTESHEVLTTIPVGEYPEFSVAVGKKLYVGNLQGNTVSVINTETDSVVATIPVVAGPYFLTVVGHKIYASGTATDKVSVIDTNTDTEIEQITVGTAPWFSGVVGTKLYVPNRLSNSVSVIDTVTDDVIATVSVTIGIQGARAIPVGTKVYISGGGNTVSVINSLTDTVTASSPITVGTTPYFGAAVGTKLFIPNRSSANVSIIDTTTDTKTNVTVGTNPFSVTVLNGLVYVNNEGSDTISVINPATNTVISTMTVGDGPFYSTAGGDKIYVSNNHGDSLSILDTKFVTAFLPNLLSFSTTTEDGLYAQGESIAITATFNKPLQAGSTMTVALNSGGTAVLNSVSGSTLSGTYVIGPSDSALDLSVTSVTSASVTDTSARTRTSYTILPMSQGDLVAENSFITRNLGDSHDITIGSHLKIPVGDNPYQVSAPITVSGVKYLYVANQGAGTVSVIAQPNHNLITTIPVGDEPYGLATASVSGVTYLYVANTGSDTVSVINTATNTVAATITVGVKPYYAAAVGTKVYVTNSMSNTVSVINAVTNTVTATVTVGSYPRGIKAHGTDVYVANYGDPNYSGGNYISVINSTTDTVSANIITPSQSDGPRGLNVLGSKVYVTNFRSSNVSVIDTATNSITHTITVGRGPRGVVGVGSNIYVENFDDSTLSVIDTGTNTVTHTVYTGNAPSGISVDGTDLYITNFQDHSMTIFNTLTNTFRSAPAVISDIKDSPIKAGVTQISWTTDKRADSLVEYSLDTSYSESVSSEDLTTDHLVELSGLREGASYYYRVTSTDEDGNITVSEGGRFRTASGGIIIGFFNNSSSGSVDPETPSTPTPTPDRPEEPEIPLVTVPVERPSFFCPGWPTTTSSPSTSTLGQRLKGMFLLAIEDWGSLWYVNTSDAKRYEVKLPTALCLLQTVSQGISNTDIAKVPTAEQGGPTTPLGERLKGSIVIQPQSQGKTSYIDLTGLRHSFTPANLLNIAKDFALGISNLNLLKIERGNQ